MCASGMFVSMGLLSLKMHSLGGKTTKINSLFTLSPLPSLGIAHFQRLNL